MSGKKRKVDGECRTFKDSWTEQFLSEFNLRACSQDFALFTNPFEAVVNNVLVHLQMELVDLQCDGDLKSKFAEVPLVKFYGEYIPHDKFPGLVNHA